ncbi:MAG TPA: hypothetical protein VMW41_05730 [Candidatus Bathyarchaeia archaeon]|nr:hypothetical protein [Candidatus Bathyarchaeia archaeon]
MFSKTASELYREYQVPPNLQEHLYKVASVGLQVVNGWVGSKEIDKGIITQVLLIHDIANIIRFDFENYSHFLQDDEERLDYWKSIQKDFIRKYGSEEHAATVKIAKEVGISDKVIYVFKNIGSRNLVRVLKGYDWNRKICNYADCRVAPYGVAATAERLDDVIRRYRKRDRRVASGELKQMKQDCLELEKQIQSSVNFNLNEITDDSIVKYLRTLPVYRFQLK